MNNPLSQSVLTQKTEAKPWANPGERSQGGAVRLRREEARFRRPMGLRLGQDRGRASPHWAKSAFSASYRRIPAAAVTVKGVQSVKKFQEKVRALTPRHHNLDASVIEKLNQVIR